MSDCENHGWVDEGRGKSCPWCDKEGEANGSLSSACSASGNSTFLVRLDMALSYAIRSPEMRDRIRAFADTLDQEKTSVFWNSDEGGVEFQDDELCIEITEQND